MPFSPRQVPLRCSSKRGENEMTKCTAALASILLALALAAFTGSALAGNGNGNGTGSQDAASTPSVSATGSASQSPGNSANAPGQAKKDQSASGTASTQGGADANANASQSGVKPTSSTAHGNHNTSCTTGGGTGSSATCTSSGSNAATAQTAAHADASKRYGNGKTAAQIAVSRGAPAGTTLYGPGNSQPHKVAICPHKTNHGGGVDVHAVKNFSATCASSTNVQAVHEQHASSTTPGSARGGPRGRPSAFRAIRTVGSVVEGTTTVPRRRPMLVRAVCMTTLFVVAAFLPASVTGADNPVLEGTVGTNDAFVISLVDASGAKVTHLDPGTYTIVVHD